MAATLSVNGMGDNLGLPGVTGARQGGHSITIHEAGDGPTPTLILAALGQAEALDFAPA
jgi:hypothetical protein